MPLHVPPAPASAARSVTAALGTPTAGTVNHAFMNATGASLVPEQPLPIHVLDPRQSAGPLPRVRLTGWRFLIRAGDGVVAAAETAVTPNGWAFSHFSEGPYLASTQRALLQAEALPAPSQPRLLSVPGLYMLCLWLHGDLSHGDDAQPAAADVLIPLAPAPPGIAAHHVYRAADLLPRLTTRLRQAPLLETAV